MTVLLGSPGQIGVCASQTAAEQLQGNQEELLSQETGSDLREKQSRGGEEQVKKKTHNANKSMKTKENVVFDSNNIF